jgi:hypothetical protein
MPDRQPEKWETNAQGPFLTMRRARGTVEVWALGADRFAVKAPGQEEQIVPGHDPAVGAAEELAKQLDLASMAARL